MSYTVTREPLGVVITGSIPVTALVALMKDWHNEGLSVIDSGVASSIGASMVVTSPEGSTAWRAEIAARNSHLDAEARWLGGTDRGMSSETIFRALASEHAGRSLASVRSRPYDDDDFGRCHRLIEAMPGWRERLDEVATKFPEWSGLVAAWPELTALHVARDHHRVYRRITEIGGAP